MNSTRIKKPTATAGATGSTDSQSNNYSLKLTQKSTEAPIVNGNNDKVGKISETVGALSTDNAQEKL